MTYNKVTGWHQDPIVTDWTALIAGMLVLLYCGIIGFMLWQVTTPAGLDAIMGAWHYMQGGQP